MSDLLAVIGPSLMRSNRIKVEVTFKDPGKEECAGHLLVEMNPWVNPRATARAMAAQWLAEHHPNTEHTSIRIAV